MGRLQCGAEPCQHGGNCTGDSSSYTCHCPYGTTGINCETSRSPRGGLGGYSLSKALWVGSSAELNHVNMAGTVQEIAALTHATVHMERLVSTVEQVHNFFIGHAFFEENSGKNIYLQICKVHTFQLMMPQFRSLCNLIAKTVCFILVYYLHYLSWETIFTGQKPIS